MAGFYYIAETGPHLTTLSSQSAGSTGSGVKFKLGGIDNAGERGAMRKSGGEALQRGMFPTPEGDMKRMHIL